MMKMKKILLSIPAFLVSFTASSFDAQGAPYNLPEILHRTEYLYYQSERRVTAVGTDILECDGSRTGKQGYTTSPYTTQRPLQRCY